MKRLAALLFVVILVVAACGSAEDDGATGASTGGGASDGATSTATTTAMDVTPTATATDLPGGEGETDDNGRAELNPDATEADPQTRDSAYPNPTATPTLAPGVPTASPTATIDFDPAALPDFPPLPEITSCEQAADLAIEGLQIWLDAIGLVPEEAIWDESLMPEPFAAFIDEWDSQMGQIESGANALGCTDAQMETLMFAGIGQLEARNPNAEVVLEMLQAMANEEPFDPDAPVTPPDDTATATPYVPTELEWDIATCEDVADFFIVRIQVLLDDLADVGLDEFTGDEAPPVMEAFETDLERLEEISDELGCTDEELNTLAAERVDQLTAEGPVAELLLQGIFDAATAGELFYE